jgi:C-terminal processing protease CtpA/Prc
MRTPTLLALPTLSLATAGCLATPSDAPVANFEAVWTEFDQHYGGFADRGIDWDDSYDRWRPQINSDSTDDQLYDALTGMLAELDDGHVMVVAPGREFWHSDVVHRDKLNDDSFDLDIVRERYLTNTQVERWGDELWYVWGEVAPGTAYVWFNWIDDNTYVMDEIIDSGAEHIIVDLRHNGGGAYPYALHGFGRVTGRDVEVFRSRTRTGPTRDDWGEWWTTTMPARGETFTGALTVLSDAWSMSATERLIMALQEVEGTVTVGVPSNGSQATMIGREAPNRWTYSLPVQQVRHMDGRSTEGVGIPVDIEILNDPEVLAEGTDEMLEAAINRLGSSSREHTQSPAPDPPPGTWSGRSDGR